MFARLPQLRQVKFGAQPPPDEASLSGQFIDDSMTRPCAFRIAAAEKRMEAAPTVTAADVEDQEAVSEFAAPERSWDAAEKAHESAAPGAAAEIAQHGCRRGVGSLGAPCRGLRLQT